MGETYMEKTQNMNVMRFKRIEQDDANRKKRLKKQMAAWDKGAKEGKVMCLSDLMGNAGM